jgi:predicted phosphodiesterase
MKILVLSDIHANITSLEAILSSVEPYEAVWCLGDLVGYGPDINECIERVKTLPNLVCITGNHDAAVSGNKNISKFNDEARHAILITQEIITPENMTFLKSLREKVLTPAVTLVHGSPRNPVWEYVIDPFTAMHNLSYFETDLCMVGHTHLPVVFSIGVDAERIHRKYLKSGEKIQLTNRTILNPGSAGQPRDHDPRASYAIFDDEEKSWTINRVEYDIHAVQLRIKAAGLPERNSIRLAEGW